VIAYLHLVLLLIITVFLLTYMFGTNLLRQSRWSRVALLIFVSGVVLNECALAAQGIAAFSYNIVPGVNAFLFMVALILLTGAALLAASTWSKQSG
jgi:hypothetical protein